MNKQIEELALKVAKDQQIAINDDEAIAFAAAFLAELAKQSEPIATVAPSKDCTGLISVEWSNSTAVRKLMFGDNLYTHPIPQADLVAEIERLKGELYQANNHKIYAEQTADQSDKVIADLTEGYAKSEDAYAAAQADNEQLVEALESAKALSAQCGERLLKAHSILKGGWLGCLDDALSDVDGIQDKTNKAIAAHKARQGKES